VAVVQGLEGLLLLNLSHNSISSDFLSHLTFASQLKLVALDLSYNALKIIKVIIQGLSLGDESKAIRMIIYPTPIFSRRLRQFF
jgi:hypothetical protein